MANDKIMVTVTVPDGLRAVVELWDKVGHDKNISRPCTVVGGTSQEFFVDTLRSVVVMEGLPHCMTDALDRKPDDA